MAAWGLTIPAGASGAESVTPPSRAGAESDPPDDVDSSSKTGSDELVDPGLGDGSDPDDQSGSSSLSRYRESEDIVESIAQWFASLSADVWMWAAGIVAGLFLLVFSIVAFRRRDDADFGDFESDFGSARVSAGDVRALQKQISVDVRTAIDEAVRDSSTGDATAEVRRLQKSFESSQQELRRLLESTAIRADSGASARSSSNYAPL